jgi:hypothetical protein
LSSIYNWSKNFSHSAYEKSEGKMAELTSDEFSHILLLLLFRQLVKMDVPGLVNDVKMVYVPE